jgi:ribosomal protein L29
MTRQAIKRKIEFIENLDVEEIQQKLSYLKAEWAAYRGNSAIKHDLEYYTCLLKQAKDKNKHIEKLIKKLNQPK